MWVRRLLSCSYLRNPFFHHNMNNTTNNAAELAAKFQVSELEPRLENAWSGGATVPVTAEAPCGSGQAPDSNGQCA